MSCVHIGAIGCFVVLAEEFRGMGPRIMAGQGAWLIVGMVCGRTAEVVPPEGAGKAWNGRLGEGERVGALFEKRVVIEKWFESNIFIEN